MTHSPEQTIFIPGYGEDPDLVCPFVHFLSEAIGEEVPTADFYRRSDHRYYANGLPSGVLARRLSEQLGHDTLPSELTLVTHSAGARVAAHFPKKHGLAMLAPEGLERGGREIVGRFASDVARRIILGPWRDRTFALAQAGNLLNYPGASLGLASEIVNETIDPARIRASTGALAVGYVDDRVMSPAQVAGAVEWVPGLKYIHLPGGHYEPFHNPGPTIARIAPHVRPHDTP